MGVMRGLAGKCLKPRRDIGNTVTPHANVRRKRRTPGPVIDQSVCDQCVGKRVNGKQRGGERSQQATCSPVAIAWPIRGTVRCANSKVIHCSETLLDVQEPSELKG